jgi:hypothetical protein
MNHYKARQREIDQRWDYTSGNPREGIHPVGYCHRYRPFSVERCAWMTAEMCEQENAKEAPFVAKYHTDGHATEEEACECYRTYLLDQRLRLWDPPPDPDTLNKCVVCGVYTAGMAELQMQHWWLCDEHRNRVEIEKLVPHGKSEAWSSY